MPADSINPFGSLGTLRLGSEEAAVFRLAELARQGLAELDRLPFSIRVLLENVLRHAGRGVVTEEHVRQLGGWHRDGAARSEIPFMPARVVLQDFTGVPCVVDLAAMRDAMARMKGDPDRINPVVPCDLVIDHSVQVDHYGSENAFRLNVQLELERNVERYQLLKFAQRAFRNFRVVPPGTGIVHQVNLEYLAPVVQLREQFGEADGLSRHPGRHRLPHHDDQRPRRAGLGRRRHRGRGGDAGAALLHADPRSGGDEAGRVRFRSAPPRPTWC